MCFAFDTRINTSAPHILFRENLRNLFVFSLQFTSEIRQNTNLKVLLPRLRASVFDQQSVKILKISGFCKRTAFFIVLPFFCWAQQVPKNSFKTNLTAAGTKIFSLQYERMLSANWSFNNTFFYRPKSSIPFGTQLDRLAKSRGLGVTGVDFQYIFVDLAEIGVKGYSPEIRYYFGNKKNRFFMGLFGQYEQFDATIPASLEARYQGQVVELNKVPIAFDIRTISGGLLIGKQFNFGNRVTLDFVLIGPHFGKGNTVYAKVEQSLLSRLDEADKAYLKNKIIDRFKLSPAYYEVTVGDEKAEISNIKKVPYAGIRGLGFNLGIRF